LAGRNDYATAEQKGAGGACWNNQEQEEYARSGQKGRNRLEEAESGGADRT
jgi:hypothetical protein